MPDCRRQCLVSRGLEKRGPEPDRIRPSVRAPDVRGIGPPRLGLLRAPPAGRRHAERVHEHRSHELLGGRAVQRPRSRPVDGIRSHGVPAAGPHRREVLQPARRRAERAAAELREPALRHGGARDGRRALSRLAPVSLVDDRFARRPSGRDGRRCARVLPALLPPGQRLARHRRRHRTRIARWIWRPRTSARFPPAIGPHPCAPRRRPRSGRAA